MSTLFNLKHLHIEISSKCTLKCPRCPRTELHQPSLNREISLEEFQSEFTSDILNSIESIAFCGDIGDPIYAKDFLKICEYIKSNSNIILRITTNGSYKSQDWWQDLANILTKEDRIRFSIDGWDQTSNEKYRVNSDWDSIVLGIETLRKNSLCDMLWSAICFKFNEEKLDHMQTMAKDFGFNRFTVVHSSKFDGRYAVNGIDLLKPNLAGVSKTAQYETSTVNFTDVSPVKKEIRKYHAWAQCLNWSAELFINVDGIVFPCPWFNSGYLTNPFI